MVCDFDTLWTVTGSTRRRSRELTIDLAALRANYAEALKHAAGRVLIAVVKADAYGHGAVVVSRTLAEAGCRRFAVVTLAEAAELRDAGIAARILLLGVSTRQKRQGRPRRSRSRL